MSPEPLGWDAPTPQAAANLLCPYSAPNQPGLLMLYGDSVVNDHDCHRTSSPALHLQGWGCSSPRRVPWSFFVRNLGFFLAGFATQRVQNWASSTGSLWMCLHAAEQGT